MLADAIIQEELEMVAGIWVDDIQRPSIHIEEIKTENGYKPGRQTWGAVLFTSSTIHNAFDLVNQKFIHVIIYVSTNEAWKFHNARIAFVSGTHCKNQQFVMIYDRAERMDTSADVLIDPAVK